MLEIVKTEDGSNTIFNSEVGENYHSKHGALQESRHVFLKSGLEYFLSVNPTNSASILEVGFGTGLNFLLSAEYCITHNITLDYTGIEAYPLSEEMIAQTGYDQYIPEKLWQEFIEEYPASLKAPVKLDTLCQLQTVHCKLQEFKSDRKYDVIYFDAFAAAYQPEMWNEAAIAHTLQFLKTRWCVCYLCYYRELKTHH